MRFKKIIYLFLFFLICISSKVSAATPPISEMTKVNLKKIYETSLPEGYYSSQGGTITDKYIISAAIYGKDDNAVKLNTALLVFDKNSFKHIKTIDDYDFGHANDMAFNPNKNEIYIIDGKKIYILDSNSLKLKKIKKLNKDYLAIAYDKTTNRFALSSHGHVIITDDKFKPISSFDFELNQTLQGLAMHNSIIYYSAHESTMKPFYDNILSRNENLVYIFDSNGNRKNILFLPKNDVNNIFCGEIETIFFEGNKIIFQYQVWGNSIKYYESTFDPIEVPVNIKIDLKDYNISDNEFSLSLYNKNKLIETRNNIANNFYFNNLTFYKPGIYYYYFKKENIDNKYAMNNNLQIIIIDIDPINNKLIAIPSTMKNVNLINNYQQIPNTISDIGLIFIFISTSIIIFIKRKKEKGLKN